MPSQFRFRQAISLTCSVLLLCPSMVLAQAGKKPSLSLKSSPAVAFAPARFVLVAELRGGDDDTEAYYCPSVEWEWGDGTTSLAEADCDPFEAGKSQIKRRYTVEHRYTNPGNFRVSLRLKKGSRVIAMANTNILVRPGISNIPGD